jgi:hypothetical protein
VIWGIVINTVALVAYTIVSTSIWFSLILPVLTLGSKK